MGHRNTHLSIGLAGSLHLHEPSRAQLDALVRVCAWAIRSNILPGINGINQIKGHMDYVATQCPGWSSYDSGDWKDDFYDLLMEALND